MKLFRMKHLFYILTISSYIFSEICCAQSVWTPIFKDKEVTVFTDENTYFEPSGKVMLWSKNITKDKVVYMHYQIQCKPKKVFRIMTINAEDKKTKKRIPMQFSDVVVELNKAPPKSPAAAVVNSICGLK